MENISENKKLTAALFKRPAGKSKLLLLIIVALILGQIPLINNVLSWQMTFFHEISHGLAALATGGEIVKIELHFSGSGLCYTSGGLRWLTLFSGYAGAALWGTLIYLLAGAIPKEFSLALAIVLLGLLLSASSFYGRDFSTWIILLLLMLMYAAAIKFREKAPLKLFLQLTGLYIIIDAFLAPLAVINHKGLNDAAELAAQTGLPSPAWVALWLLVSLACLAFIWKAEKAVRVAPKLPGVNLNI